MSELKASKKIKYKVGSNKRAATHGVTLTFTTTKVGNATVLDMKKLKVSGSYENGAWSDGSIRGRVQITIRGTKVFDVEDTFHADGSSSDAETRFVYNRREAVADHSYYGGRWNPTTLQYEVVLAVAVTIYNPQTKKYEIATAKSVITIAGTGIVALKGKPTSTVTRLASPVRSSGGSRVMTSTWDVPDNFTKGTNANRASKLKVQWVVSTGSTKNKATGQIKHTGIGETSTKQSQFNLASISADGGKTYNRASFYPSTTRTLTAVTIMVAGTNSLGEGPYAKATRTFSLPKAPTISAITQNESTGTISFTIKSDLGQGYAERYDTRYQVTITDSSKPKAKRTIWSDDSTFTAESKTVTRDLTERMALGATDYIHVHVRAWSRGFRGDSTIVERNAYVGWPLKPTIKSISVPKMGSTADLLSSKATVTISTGATTEHPVTGIKLEKLVDVEYTKASDIPGNAEWEESGAVDNGSCTALAVTVGEIMPQAGNRTWLRLKSWNAIESIYKTYSAPMQVTALYRKAPTAEDDSVRVVSVTGGDDGKSAVVVLAWKNDDSTGTEVSWSDKENAWRSTEQPKTYQVTESDGPITVGGTTYANSYTLYITGLTEEVTYYVRARRYLEGDNATTYGKYYPANTGVSVTPLTIPDSCTVNIPSYVERGKSVEVTWGYDGEVAQKKWELITGPVAVETDSDGVRHYRIKAKGQKSIQKGSGSVGSYVIGAERLASLVGTASKIYIAAKVSVTGSTDDYVVSDAKALTIADAPSIRVVADTLTAQPMSLNVACDVKSDLSVVVSAQGADGDWPDGQRSQQDGDTIWSALVQPVWTQEQVNDSNMLTNDSGMWVRETYGSDGRVSQSSYELALASEQAIVVESGTQYTVSVTGSGYQIAAAAFEDGEYLSGESVGWQSGSSLTFTPQTANGIIVRVRKTGGGEEILPDEVGASVFVKMEEGGTATAWTPAPSDVLGFSATVTLPEGLDFWDGARYTAQVRAVARNTGMSSDEVSVPFGVDFARKAAEPTELTTVDPVDETEEDGSRTRSATITLVPPDGVVDGDLCDVYRLTPDGPRLLIGGVQPDSVVYDKWAPFGNAELAYRVALRTPDGSVAWQDIPYSFGEQTVFNSEVRVDYGEEYVELDRNISVSDDYEKDFEARTHLDGTTNGYWNQGVSRTSSIDGVVIRVYDMDTIARLRALARHIGPTFVRTYDGVAYEAHTTVSIGMARGTAAVSVSLSSTEIEASQYLGVVVEDGEEEEEEEGEG